MAQTASLGSDGGFKIMGKDLQHCKLSDLTIEGAVVDWK